MAELKIDYTDLSLYIYCFFLYIFFVPKRLDKTRSSANADGTVLGRQN